MCFYVYLLALTKKRIKACKYRFPILKFTTHKTRTITYYRNQKSKHDDTSVMRAPACVELVS